MKFTDSIWEAAKPIYQKIVEHPFNQEMIAGTLPVEKFKFYIYQDSLYLAEFSKALAVTGSHSGTSHDLLEFLHFAQNCIFVENALHEGYFKDYNINYTFGAAPGCFMYTNYLKATATFDSYEVAVAALLPCFWIYKRIGDHIYMNQAKPNPYQKWIDTYSGEAFGISVQKILDICDRLGAAASESTKLKMQEAYITASRMEYIFWDSAYKLEKWPV